MNTQLLDVLGAGNLKKTRQLLQNLRYPRPIRGMVLDEAVGSFRDFVHAVQIMFKGYKSAERDRRGRRRIEPGRRESREMFRSET